MSVDKAAPFKRRELPAVKLTANSFLLISLLQVHTALTALFVLHCTNVPPQSECCPGATMVLVLPGAAWSLCCPGATRVLVWPHIITALTNIPPMWCQCPSATNAMLLSKPHLKHTPPKSDAAVEEHLSAKVTCRVTCVHGYTCNHPRDWQAFPAYGCLVLARLVARGTSGNAPSASAAQTAR
jgi:hypothetical protein